MTDVRHLLVLVRQPTRPCCPPSSHALPSKPFPSSLSEVFPSPILSSCSRCVLICTMSPRATDADRSLVAFAARRRPPGTPSRARRSPSGTGRREAQTEGTTERVDGSQGSPLKDSFRSLPALSRLLPSRLQRPPTLYDVLMLLLRQSCFRL